LHYFSENYEIRLLHDNNTPVEPQQEILLRGKNIPMTLKRGVEKEIDYFQLIVSEEFLDLKDFEPQDAIEKGKNIKADSIKRGAFDDEEEQVKKIKWIVKTLEIHTVWETETVVGKTETTLPESTVNIEAHTELTATVSLESAMVKGRGLETPDDLAMLALQHLPTVRLGANNNATVLNLQNIDVDTQTSTRLWRQARCFYLWLSQARVCSL
jgi:hypothetical protein